MVTVNARLAMAGTPLFEGKRCRTIAILFQLALPIPQPPSALLLHHPG